MADSNALIAQLRAITAPRSGRVSDSAGPDDWLMQGAPAAQLHEIYGMEAEDGPAATGFAVALALAGQKQGDTTAIGHVAAPILWVRQQGRGDGRLHATGLLDLGLAPDALVLAEVPDPAALLRVAADAARCPGLGTVIVETHGRVPGLDLTATRRLMLAAEASGVTVLSVRLAAQVEPSAAASRWGIAAMPSRTLPGDVFGTPAPGRPAFLVECLRRRGGPAGTRWPVEWNRETRHFVTLPAQETALPGAGLPLVADRAVARNAAPSIRRAG
jgi:protein ImuA